MAKRTPEFESDEVNGQPLKRAKLAQFHQTSSFIQDEDRYVRDSMEKLNITTLQPWQRESITATMSNKNVLAIKPTGCGKSLSYQLPSLALNMK